MGGSNTKVGFVLAIDNIVIGSYKCYIILVRIQSQIYVVVPQHGPFSFYDTKLEGHQLQIIIIIIISISIITLFLNPTLQPFNDFQGR